MNDNPKRWDVQGVLAMYAMTLVAGTVGGAFVVGEPNLRAALAGAVVGYAAAAIQFYFGSSTGSQRKDDTIAAANQALAGSAPLPLPPPPAPVQPEIPPTPAVGAPAPGADQASPDAEIEALRQPTSQSGDPHV